MGNGAVGASLVTIVTEIVMFGGAMLLIPRHLIEPRVIWDAARIFLAGGAIVVAGSALLPAALALAIAGGALAYVVTVVVLRAFTLDDLRLILSRLPLARRAA
jgi:hypothetical protein